MRFLFVHQNFPAQYRHVSGALAERGHSVVALGMQPGPAVPGVRHLLYRIAAGAPPGASGPGAAAGREWASKVARGIAAADAMRSLRQEGFVPDVVAVHPGWGEALFVRDVFPHARLVAYAEYFYGGVGGDSGFDPEFEDRSASFAQRLRLKNSHLLHALNDCDLAVSPTEFQKSRHPAWALDRISVIHDGIDTDLLRPDPDSTVRLQKADLALGATDEVVTFVARHLEPYRGYHVFMRALPLLQQLRPRAQVVLVGGDGVAYGAAAPTGSTWKAHFLREVAGGLDMRRVHFVGQLPHALLTRLMQVSRVHVYLTYPFVLSWSMLEAMSVGCLVVGSDTAPVREVLEDGRNGLLADFFDPQQLARTIADALETGGGMAPLRAKARQTIVERFDLRRACLPAQIDLLERG